MKKWQWALIGAVAVVAIAAVVFLVRSSSPMAATVNGVGIPESEVQEELDRYKEQQPDLFKGAAGKTQEKRLRDATLDVLITQELLRQEAKKENIKVSDSEIDAKIDQVKKAFPDQKQFDQALKQQGLTEAELRDKASEQIISEKMLKKVAGNTTVSEKEMHDFYDKNKSQLTEPEQKRYSQILVKDKKKADDLHSQLQDGADFAQVAKDNSIDTATKDKGGNLGMGVPLPPEATSAVKDLKVNDISGVVKASDGYHIYRLDEVKASRQQSYDEVKSQIKQYLETDKQRAKFTEWIDKLKKKANIVKNEKK